MPRADAVRCFGINAVALILGLLVGVLVAAIVGS